MTAPERIDHLIRTLEGNNAAEFSRKTGIDRGALSCIRRGVRYRPDRYFDRILRAYPDVRPEWLLRGEGPASRSEERESAVAEKLDALIAKVDRLTSMLEELVNAS